jgi:hypothetical protein
MKNILSFIKLMNEQENDTFITTIKKKTPKFNKSVDSNYKLIKPIKQKNKKHFSFDEIIKMVEAGPIINFKPTQKRTVLDKIVEEPEPKIDYHLQIKQYVHSCSISNVGFRLSWPFGNNCMFTLIRHNATFIKDHWYYEKDRCSNIIRDPQQFINDHINDFEAYMLNYKITNDTITQLEPILGEYYLTFIEIGWGLSIGDDNFLKIVIDRFNINNTTVTFDGKTCVHDNVSLLKFVNENLDKITTFKQKIVEYNLNKQKESKEKRIQDLIQTNIENDLRNLQLEEKLKEYDSTIKQKKKSNLFIKRSKKELIETITCKPYHDPKNPY